MWQFYQIQPANKSNILKKHKNKINMFRIANLFSQNSKLGKLTKMFKTKTNLYRFTFFTAILTSWISPCTVLVSN